MPDITVEVLGDLFRVEQMCSRVVINDRLMPDIREHVEERLRLDLVNCAGVQVRWKSSWDWTEQDGRIAYAHTGMPPFQERQWLVEATGYRLVDMGEVDAKK